MDALIYGKKVRLDSSKLIGGGGEAEVFNIGGGQVAKIFMPPDHPNFVGNPNAQKAAKFRIEEHQKKLKLFPTNLPKEVITPTSLVMSADGQKVIGYTMKFLSGSGTLLEYGNKKYLEAKGLSHNDSVTFLKNLYALVSLVHKSGVVIGDFNDLNVLIDKTLRTYMVDADSMQFGGFYGRTFTEKFVDPLLCEQKASHAELIKPHNENSDWYAYLVMLMQSLLFVSPYGGVHSPVKVANKLKEWSRVLGRVTVFNQEVKYPRPALHYSVLPDALLDHFHRVFEKDERGEMPKSILDTLMFTTCPICKKVHARSSCPTCQINSPSIVKEVVSGNVEAMKVLDTSGRVIYATTQGGIPRYVYHENNAYYREGGDKVLDGNLDPSIRFRLNGENTILAKDGEVIAFLKDKMQKRFTADVFRGKVSIVDSNLESVFIASFGEIKKVDLNDLAYSRSLGKVISNQAMVWVGDKLGLTFYFAGGMLCAHIFHSQSNSLGGEVDIGKVNGQIIDATTVFSDNYVWFLMSVDEGGRRLNKAFMFDEFGKSQGQAETTSTDGSWLGSIRGKCAKGTQLFSPTDDGIVRVEANANVLSETKVFAETNRFVDSSSKLLFGKDGIYTVDSNRIWRLRMR